MVANHPLAKQLSSMKTSELIVDFAKAQKENDDDGEPKVQSHLSLTGWHESDKAKEIADKQKNNGYGLCHLSLSICGPYLYRVCVWCRCLFSVTSTNVDEFSGKTTVGHRKKLKTAMLTFLDKMQLPRRVARTSSFFFGEKEYVLCFLIIVSMSSSFFVIVSPLFLSDRREDHETMGTLVDLNHPHGDGEEDTDPGKTTEMSLTISEKDSHKLLFLKPWVFNPNHLYRQAWDLIAVMMSLLYTALRIPYAIGMYIEPLISSNVICSTVN